MDKARSGTSRGIRSLFSESQLLASVAQTRGEFLMDWVLMNEADATGFKTSLAYITNKAKQWEYKGCGFYSASGTKGAYKASFSLVPSAPASPPFPPLLSVMDPAIQLPVPQV